MDYSNLYIGLNSYPKPPVDLQYGTAGFRTKAELLDHVAFRVGVLASIRSGVTGKTTGIMITASHNQECDNGVKIVDPNGGMLVIDWEDLATELVNCDATEMEHKIDNIVKSNEINFKTSGKVLVGWDSRPSSSKLVDITCEGIESIGFTPTKIGLCPTPLLHFVVRCSNDQHYGLPNAEGYYHKLETAFTYLWTKGNEIKGKVKYENEIVFDGANGVGTLSMRIAERNLKNMLQLKLFNVDLGVVGKLNYNCGADFVKVNQSLPINIPFKPYQKYVSFDGDADRIIYYYLSSEGTFHLLDGDRMAVLIATFLRELVEGANLNNMTFGIVQTAYANGNSTKYIKEKLKLDPLCVKTGVKYLHEKAIEYDIGIYFEANGHGTVIFSDSMKNQIKQLLENVNSTNEKSLLTLQNFINLVNETIGDSYSDFLIIETILHWKNWSLQDWMNLYTNLPNVLAKVNVKDRNVIKTFDAERKIEQPSKLQIKIDELIAKYRSGRSFVRPSGTEDIVRVYAEAETAQESEELCKLVSQLVYDMADGIGPRP